MRRLFLALILASIPALAGAADDPCAGRTDTTGIPLVERHANRARPQDRHVVIMLTGDGGWRRIDVRVTNRFRDQGMPVVGFLTPDYYRVRRTPEEAACALDRVIRHYREAWKCDRVVIVGYSRGADILPFILSRLAPDVRSSIDLVALLGLEPTIDFLYRPNWIPGRATKEPQYPVLPEIEKLSGYPILCFYGEKEKDSLCHALDPRKYTLVGEPGSHHFGGNYVAIADDIINSLAAVTPR